MIGIQTEIPQPNPQQPALDQSASQAILSRLARRLARSMADAADADQWAIAVVGLDNLGPPDFDEWVSRAWLQALNDGAPARYRITLVLQAPERDLGIVRLGTIRPHGFSEEQVTAAKAAADHATKVLNRAFEEHAVPAAIG